MSAPAAASVGIDVVRAKAFVFGIGALLTGLSGGLYAYFARSFNANCESPTRRFSIATRSTCCSCNISLCARRKSSIETKSTSKMSPKSCDLF